VVGAFKAQRADAWDQDQVVDCNGGNDDTCFYPYQQRAAISTSGSAIALYMESRSAHEVLTSAVFDTKQPPSDGDDGGDSGSSGDASSADSLAIATDPGTGTILDHMAALLPGQADPGHGALRQRAQLPWAARAAQPPAHAALAGLPVQVGPRHERTIVMRLTGLPGAVLWKGARLRVQVSVQRVRRGRLVRRGSWSGVEA
jgi:hypothetical protein